MLTKPIQLLVGLGNPGAEYDGTRHNAGADFLKHVAHLHSLTFKSEHKFHGLYARLQSDSHDCHLLIPTTYMNRSGIAVRAVSEFYKIETAAIAVAHDDLDLPTGTVRLRPNGGHGGHNGLRDIINHLSTQDFARIRIGIGHPGVKHEVSDYVLTRPTLSEKNTLALVMEDTARIVPQLLRGEFEKAVYSLHNRQEK